MILIEHNGERQLVESLDGVHEDAVILSADIGPPPSDFCTFVAGAWVEDAAAKAEDQRCRDIRGQDAVALHDELQARIAELEATLQVMAPMVEQISGISLETGLPMAE